MSADPGPGYFFQNGEWWPVRAGDDLFIEGWIAARNHPVPSSGAIVTSPPVPMAPANWYIHRCRHCGVPIRRTRCRTLAKWCKLPARIVWWCGRGWPTCDNGQRSHEPVTELSVPFFDRFEVTP